MKMVKISSQQDIQMQHRMLLKRSSKFRKEIESDRIKFLHKYLCILSATFGLVVTKSEAKRLHFISPILACVCALFDGDVQVLIEEDVIGKQVHVNGHFEFVIQRGNKRICIVEAKKDDFAKGFAQDLFGCEAMAEGEELNLVYGIVTNYMEWYFVRSTDLKVENDQSPIELVNGNLTYDSVKKIAEKIYAMLSDQPEENEKERKMALTSE